MTRYLIIFIAILAFSCQTTAVQRIEAHKDRIVRITSDNGSSATAFRLTHKGKTYWVTAQHFCAASIAMTGGLKVGLEMTTGKVEEKILSYSLRADVCVVSDSVGGYSYQAGEAEVGSSVYTAGYPGGLGYVYREGQALLTEVSDTYIRLALPTDVVVCAPGSFGIDANGGICFGQQPFIASNIEVFYGQSGSPLVLSSNDRVVGVLSQKESIGSKWAPIDEVLKLIDSRKGKK